MSVLTPFLGSLLPWRPLQSYAVTTTTKTGATENVTNHHPENALNIIIICHELPVSLPSPFIGFAELLFI